MQVSIQAAVEAAPLFEIDEDTAVFMAHKMATKINNTWRQKCVQVGMSAQEILDYEHAFVHPDMKLELNQNNVTTSITREPSDLNMTVRHSGRH